MRRIANKINQFLLLEGIKIHFSVDPILTSIIYSYYIDDGGIADNTIFT